MSPTGTLKNAGKGWSGILANKDGWQRNFALDANGLNFAFLAYGIGVVLTLVLASFRVGFPPPTIMALAVIAHLIPALVLVGLTVGLRRIVNFEPSILNFIVPGLLMLALLKIIEGVSLFIGIPLSGAILALTGFVGYYLARANGLGLAIALGFGLAMFVLVAGLPIALYMLVSTLS